MKWISKSEAVMEQSSDDFSGKHKDYKSSDYHRALREWRRAGNNAREKLGALKVSLKLNTNCELSKFLGVSMNRLRGLLHQGIAFSGEEEKLVNDTLKKHGIEIKERVISFE